MTNWHPQYDERTRKAAQEPAYCVLIFEDRTRLGLISGSPVIEGDVYDSMTLRDTGDLRTFMLYDADGFELDTGVYDSATNQIAVSQYGAFGTETRTFSPSLTTIGALWMAFSTEAVPGTGTLFEQGMGFPSGAQQELDMIEGYTRSQPVSVQLLDTNARITRALKGTSLIGKTAVVLGGYRGLAFSRYTFLHAGPITRMTLMRGSYYELEIDTVLVKLKRKLFADVEQFGTTLSGGMTNVQTTIPLTSAADVYDSAPTIIGAQPGQPHTSDTAFLSAMYFKVDNEYMRHDSGTGPVNVTRGMFGSSAATHSGGATVDMLFAVEGNPINVLLGILLTRDPGYQPLIRSNPPYGHIDFWNTVDDDKGPLGMHLEGGDVDLESFTAIRDKWVSRTYGRFVFSKATDMETYLRAKIMKPLGLNFYVTRAGKLGLTIIRPALGADEHVLDESRIIGIPDIDFTNEEIVNEVTVNYQGDPVTSDTISAVTVLDATSQSTYDRAGDAMLDTPWLIDGYFGGGLSKASSLARAKMRHHREPNPQFTVNALFTETRADIGSIPRVTLAGLPDPRKGRIGWNELSLIVGRRVDWDTGALAFDIIHTAYFGRRYCMIAPTGMVDYPAASDDQRAIYGFLADSGTGLMSDGSQPYLII